MTTLYSSSIRRRILIITAGGAIGLSMFLGGSWLARSSSDGLLRPLQTAQDASATDAGITIKLIGATFSGTGTWVQFVATVEDDARFPGVTTVTVPAEGLVDAGLTPIDAGDGVLLQPRGGGPVILRFAPLVPGVSPLVRIRSVDLAFKDGGTLRVNGDWTLPLVVSGSLHEALRIERLVARNASSVAEGGISVRLLSAVRSSSETLVTVEVVAEEPVVMLAEPVLVVGSDRLTGGVLRSMEDGGVLELGFPPTPFGTSPIVVLGPWTIASTPAEVFSDINVPAVLSRGVPDESGKLLVEVAAGDIIGSAPGQSPVRFVELGRITRVGSSTEAIAFHLAGNFEAAENVHAVLPGGTAAVTAGSISEYRKDQGGAVFAGTTAFWFPYRPADWEGTVRLYHGTGGRIIRGSWALSLEPAR